MGDLCPWCGEHIDPFKKVWITAPPAQEIYHFACGMLRMNSIENPYITFQGHAYSQVSPGRWRYQGTM